MRVLVSGARGMVGTAIVELLRGRGDEVGALVRGGRPSAGLDVAWDPAAGTIDDAALEAGRFDAVVHLAGESIVGRWTEEKRLRILDSRVQGTTVLARALAGLPDAARPRTFAVASATGWYGDRGDEVLTEQSPAGTGFLADVVQAWEASADAAREAGIRTVHLRLAPVYGRGDGVLQKQLLPFQLGVGGRVGHGRQWCAWVGLHEAARIWCFALDHEEIEGAVNVVGPTPVRNREIAKILGRVLHRPAVLPAPVPLMKLALSADLVEEMLLVSQKVVPARLEAFGYEFADRTVEGAIRRELGKPRA